MKSARVLAGILFLFGMLVAICLPSLGAEAGQKPPIRLFVREVPLKILGQEVKVMAIEQENGARGFDPQTSQGFDVEVVNELKEPTCIHWHGILLPALMDGVPYVSQDPIPPNGTMAYKFPLKQCGKLQINLTALKPSI
jgi:Multicopper oxidase